ncbi:MAG: hypothetical protein IKW14_02425 [Phascolarctobacterium sp.]|nr:hypothetical protein [Phascolarctobacterium sp.]
MGKTWQVICPSCGEQLEVYGEEEMIKLYELERKDWQRKAHASFDPIWKSGIIERGLAYSWLARELGIEYADCHFSEMSVPQLKRAIGICELAKARMLKIFCQTEWDEQIKDGALPTGKCVRNDFKTTGVDRCTPIT